MNISNTISYDSTYSKNDSSQPEIKQSVPVSINKSHFSEKIDRIDTVDNSEKKEKNEMVLEAIGKANVSLEAFDRKLEISVHQKTKEVMVKVIDTLTDEVIREIPSEKVLDTVAYRKEALGMLMDQKI